MDLIILSHVSTNAKDLMKIGPVRTDIFGTICQFLTSFYRATLYAKRGICRRRVSVCLSVCVCLSVTLRYCIKTAKRRITQITPHDSLVTLVF